MKAADIEPGVVYAWQDVRWMSPHEIVFLVKPGRDTLWTENSERRNFRPKPGLPWFVPAEWSVRPEVSTIYGATGWPAVKPYGVHDRVKAASTGDLLKVTLDDFRTITDPHDRKRGIEFVLVTHLPKVTGVYADIVAERERQDKAREQAEAERDAERERNGKRAQAVCERLVDRGLKLYVGEDGAQVSLEGLEYIAQHLISPQLRTEFLAEVIGPATGRILLDRVADELR